MANESLDVNYSVVNDWGSGSQGQISITNSGSGDVENWELDFDLPSNITNIWGAEIVNSDGGEYDIQPTSWNSEIQSGETITVGFISNSGGVTADNFDISGSFDAVDTPEVIDTPNTPETPEVVDTPETPEVVDTPETPEVVDTPETPEVVDTPEVINSPNLDSTSELTLGENYQGRGTFYNPSGVLGNSGYDPISGSQVEGLTAINTPQWNGSEASGAFLQVSGPKQRAGADPIIVQVFDQLPDRGDGLDLSQEGFAKIADPIDGIVDIEYELIGPGDNFQTPYGYTIGQGIVAEGVTGTNPFYAAVRLNNLRYPVESVDLIEEDGDLVSLNRGSDNRFELDNPSFGPIEGGQDLLVTDIFGQQVTLDNINITSGDVPDAVTGEQFSLL